MDDPAADLLVRAEEAYAGAVRDPGGQRSLPQLVAAARHARASEALVVALRAQAWCARSQLAGLQAKAHLDEAVRLAERHGLSHRLPQLLATRAAVLHELGRVDAAQRDLDRARATASSAELDLQQAVLFHNRGRLSEAADLYRRLLDGDAAPDVRVKVGNNLALVECAQGHYDQARARLERLVADAEQVGPALVAVVEDSRGWVTVQSGRLGEGLRLLHRAADAHRAAGLPLGEHYLEHSDALVELRLLPEARAMTGRALEQFERYGVELLAAEAQLRVARLALLEGDHADAAAAAAAAEAKFRRQRRGTWAARAQVLAVEARAGLAQADASDATRLCRAGVLLEQAGLTSWAADAYLAAGRRSALDGRPAVALEHLHRARRLCLGGPALVRVKGHLAAATAGQLTGSRREVLDHARAGLRDLARHRAVLPTAELRALASGHGLALGRLALGGLLRDGSPGQVLRWMERTRAAAFLTAEPDRSEGVQGELAQLRAVHAELAEARARGTEPPVLRAQQRALEAALRRASWERQAGGPVAPARLSLGRLRPALGGRALVEYGTHEGDLFAVTVRTRRTALVRLGRLDAVEVQARRLLFALRRLAEDAAPPPVQAAFQRTALDARTQLRTSLVAPLGLPPDQPVVVVPSARTWTLPWAALFEAPVELAPSAATWLRTAGATAPGQGVLLVAGPDLSGAEAEVAALRALHPGCRVLRPPDSTVEAVLAEVARVDLAHLACHGRLRADNPTFSSFLLSGGELTLHELDAQERAPHRIVLSACESAAGAAYDGDELVGFVSALFARGTAGLLASCVPVSDAAVVPLMCAVHAAIADGDSLSQALARATGELDEGDPRQLAARCAFSACGAA